MQTKQQLAYPLSVVQVADVLRESKYVIQNWMRAFRSYIQCEKRSGINYFDESALTLFFIIQHLHRKLGYSIYQITEYFENGFPPALIDQCLIAEKDSHFALCQETLDTLRVNMTFPVIQEPYRQSSAEWEMVMAIIQKQEERLQAIEKTLLSLPSPRQGKKGGLFKK